MPSSGEDENLISGSETGNSNAGLVEPYVEDAEASEEDQPSSAASNEDFTSRKRHHLAEHVGAPLKRQRCAFNSDYLTLLNDEIADAAAQTIVEEEVYLKPSQIGATRWTDVEKETFFSALARLGRGDFPGIAARIGTKSQLEVYQYIMFLSKLERTRRNDQYLRRKTLKPAEIPASCELSHECCVALEDAADDVSLRQEKYETAVEEKRWGDHWNITLSVLQELEDQPRSDMPFLNYFVIPNWLMLSDRIFLNSVIPDFNWRYMSEEPPTIRSTALADMYALFVNITKRLVSNALIMAHMRIDANKEAFPAIKSQVKARDVRAAIDSMSMSHDSRDFWARAARRLRLDVMRDAPRDHGGEPTDHDSSDQEDLIMSHAEAEAALGLNISEGLVPSDPESESDDEDSSDDFDTAAQEDPADFGPSAAEGGKEEGETEGERSDNMGIDDEAVQRDLREAMHFSAEYEGTTRARQGLQGRIVTEHRLEAEAEEHDAQASVTEEAKLWAVLRRQPAGASPEISASAEKKQPRRAVYEPAAADWREQLKYVSEWETA